jgi:hypothetical protein
VPGNNEITCGNSYSTLYHVTAWANSNTKLAGDLNYDICSNSTDCLAAADASWDLAQSEPFTGNTSTARVRFDLRQDEYLNEEGLIRASS